MKYFKNLFYGLILILVSFGSTNGKDWRGIVPLHSTLGNVEKLLGKSTLGVKYAHKTKEGIVFFKYQSNPYTSCKNNPNQTYDVPYTTILSIQFEPSEKPLLTDLNLDMSKFSKYSTCIGAIGYYNKKEGIEMHTYNEAVHRFYYKPTLADREKFACPNK